VWRAQLAFGPAERDRREQLARCAARAVTSFVARPTTQHAAPDARKGPCVPAIRAVREGGAA
jgi:hypothetical protein